MPLTLRIQSYRKQPPAVAVERRFDAAGGTLGRGEGNDLVLPDPGKYISRNHSKIGYSAGRFTLIDLGSNPSWINDKPLGTGKQGFLEDGDHLMIGDYVLDVVVDEAASALPLFAPAATQAQPQSAEHEPDSFASASILNLDSSRFAAGTPDDPLGLSALSGNLPTPGRAHQPAFRGSESDQIAPEMMSLPTSLREGSVAPKQAPGSMLIPDDYDPLADLLAPRASQPTPAPVQRAAPPPQQPQPAAPKGPSEQDVLAALLRGLNVPTLKVERPVPELAELVGAMLREATAGTMEVLMARSLTKRESRLEMTQLGAAANNPLKFFPDAESALSQMLTGAVGGYMPPMKSIGSAFEDLKAHELAVIAGMRAALAGVMQRFNPHALEQRTEPDGMMDKMLSASRKAKLWDSMVALYDDVAREADDDFQHLFGEKFSEAYADQINRLRRAAR